VAAKAGKWAFGIQNDQEQLCWWRVGVGVLACAPFSASQYVGEWIWISATVFVSTYNSDRHLRLYIDGQKVAETGFPYDGTGGGETPVLLGAALPSGDDPDRLRGALDDVGIGAVLMGPDEFELFYTD